MENAVEVIPRMVTENKLLNSASAAAVGEELSVDEFVVFQVNIGGAKVALRAFLPRSSKNSHKSSSVTSQKPGAAIQINLYKRNSRKKN